MRIKQRSCFCSTKYSTVIAQVIAENEKNTILFWKRENVFDEVVACNVLPRQVQATHTSIRQANVMVRSHRVSPTETLKSKVLLVQIDKTLTNHCRIAHVSPWEHQNMKFENTWMSMAMVNCTMPKLLPFLWACHPTPTSPCTITSVAAFTEMMRSNTRHFLDVPGVGKQNHLLPKFDETSSLTSTY